MCLNISDRITVIVDAKPRVKHTDRLLYQQFARKLIAAITLPTHSHARSLRSPIDRLT